MCRVFVHRNSFSNRTFYLKRSLTMKSARLFAVAALFAIISLAFAQTDTVTATGTQPAPTVTVTLMTDAATPADFGTSYAIGQLNNSTYAYGPNFLINTTYANVTTSIGLAISGSQSDYALAYRHNQPAGTVTSDVAFASVGSVNISGAATDTYVSGTTTTAYDGFSTAVDATRFAIGAKSTTAAAVALNTVVTITVTVQ